MVEWRNGRASYGGIEEVCEISAKRGGIKAGRSGFVFDNCQLLSTYVYSKELSLLVDDIVNGPRAP